MTHHPDDRILFENDEWSVSDDGLEHKRTAYFIARDAVGRRQSDGLWSWPLHMAEKSWCAMSPFAEAFTCAASAYGHAPDADLARSFHVARCEIVAFGEPRDEAQNLRNGASIPTFHLSPQSASLHQSQRRVRSAESVLVRSERPGLPRSGAGWPTRRLSRFVRLIRTAWSMSRAYSAG